MSKKISDSVATFIVFIVVLSITILAILIKIHVINLPENNPDADRGFIEAIRSLIDFQTLAGWASIIGVPLSLFFGCYSIYTTKKSNKEHRKEIEELQKSKFKPIDMSLWNMDLTEEDSESDKKRADLSIDRKTYDNGYETTLTIRNNGEAEAKNVMVEVLPDAEQNLTNARIVNAEILPKETVYPKGSFQVTVECWYPKAYRDVVVTWEDTKPRKIVQNVQLSKNYVV